MDWRPLSILWWHSFDLGLDSARMAGIVALQPSGFPRMHDDGSWFLPLDSRTMDGLASTSKIAEKLSGLAVEFDPAYFFSFSQLALSLLEF